jgi:hypothetical protein
MQLKAHQENPRNDGDNERHDSHRRADADLEREQQ